MTEPLSTVCDHCDAKLKLKNPDLEGKKIKCPKCGEAFVVVAAAAASPVKKPVKKKPADDDDMDFMNVDADDYDSPVDEDEDQDDDDAPRGRRRPVARGGKKKTKKKSKKGSGDSAQVIKILALVLVALGVLGGGGFAMMTLLKGDGSSDVDWMPSEIEGFVKIQIDDIWAANVAQPLKNNEFVKKIVDDITAHIGQGPQDIDRVVISLLPNSRSNDVIMVARAKTPFDTAKIQAADKAITEASHNSTTYYKTASTALYFPDSKTMVLGTESLVKALIERGKTHPSPSKFAFANNYRDHFVMAASRPSSSVRNTMAYPGGQDIDAILVLGNATSDIRISISGTYKTADAAKANADKTKADNETAKKNLVANITRVEATPDNPLIKKDQVLKVMRGTEQLMNSMQVSQSGTRVNMNMTVQGQLLADFLEMTSLMPTSPLRRFSLFGQQPQSKPQPQQEPQKSIGWE